jgi:DNA-binding beta-propeller fold protein YncE
MGRSFALFIVLLAASRVCAVPKVVMPRAGCTGVAILDTATDSIEAELGGCWGNWSVAVHPDGTRAYLGTDDRIDILDIPGRRLAGVAYPYQVLGLAVDPRGHVIHAANRRLVERLAYPSHATVGRITYDDSYYSYGPVSVALHPSGSPLYVMRENTGEVTVIDTVLGTVDSPIAIANARYGALSPDGSRLFVTAASGLFEVDTATGAVQRQLALTIPLHVATHPDGAKVYVVTRDSSTFDSLVEIDVPTLLPTRSVLLLSGTNGFVVHPDGSRLYLTNYTGSATDGLSVIDALSLTERQRTSLFFLQGIAVGGCRGPEGDCDGDGLDDGVDDCPLVANPDQSDVDGDDSGDSCDNCPSLMNADQADADANGVGDACQDIDADGVPDIFDNCPRVANSLQENADGDAHGDVCDVCPGSDDDQHGDSDGLPDGCDNCPATPNGDQADGNGNGIGDACDDRDGDGAVDANDNCVDLPNPGQEDGDRDRLGDACDACFDTDHDGFGDPGVPNDTCPDDNCPRAANPGQVDSNGDGVGDACIICSRMRGAAPFPMTAQDKVKWRTGSGYYPTEVHLYGDTCARKVTGIAGSADDIVATEGTRTAVSLRGMRGPYATEAYAFGIISGGGRIVLASDVFPIFVDPSGDHPWVQRCRDAQATSLAASRYFASLPPTRVYDDIVIRGEAEHVLDVGSGGVIEVGNLTVAGRHGYYTCDEYGRLSIVGDPDIEGDVIINVRNRLELGECGFIANETYFSDRLDHIVINAAGSGAVKFGRASGTQVAILAPERAVSVRGSTNHEEPTFLEPLWARRLELIGYVEANRLEYGGTYGASYCGVPGEFAPEP